MTSLRPLAALAVAGLVAAGCSSSQQTAHRSSSASDSQATRDLTSAAEAMRVTRGYRFVATVQSDQQATVARGEFEAPDRVHETISVGDRQAAELVMSGARVVLRDPRTGAWRTQHPTGAGATSDPRAAFVTLSGARDVRGDGTTYRFTLSKEAGAALARGGAVSDGVVTGEAVLAGGRINSLDYTVPGRGRTLHVRVVYTDINTAPPVAVPV